MTEKKPAPPHYSAQDVRGGDIVLRTDRQRLVFIGGLAGAALFGLIAGVLLI